MSRYETLVELLSDRAERDPEFRGYSWLGDDGEVAEEFSYAELETRARAIAAELLSRAAPGERVLLLHPPGLDFVAAYFGCLFAGLIAVPAYPPARPRDQRRIAGICASAKPAIVLGAPGLLERAGELTALSPELGAAHWLVSRDIANERAADFVRRTVASSTVAFLQYTSGSTGDPKGVMVTHENLLANEEMIQRAFESDERSTVVGWLPHFHDMGLIGNILQPLYTHSRNILMSPSTLLRDPLRWLKAIAKFRGRVSGGPNFAYELCALRSGRLTEGSLDLSSWELAFIGAEPVRPATLELFAKTFEPYGFRREALYPCYGLAEATLFVSGVKALGGPTLKRYTAGREGKARTLVSCGEPADGETVVIVDPESRERCANGVEGEIWIAGPNVALGYWQRQRETEETFAARLRDDPTRSFLRSGDLGVFVDGELLITGRLKDLIIVRGQNFYPQDIESVVERVHPALRASSSAAFSFTELGEERVCVVAEVAKNKLTHSADDVLQSIRVSVAEELELRLDVVVLVAAQSVPKTSSGKIERRAARQVFLAGEFDVVAASSVIGLPDAAWARALRAPTAGSSEVALAGA